MKQVLITGATSGIGQQLALNYAAQGYQVWACGRNQEKLAALSQQSPHIQSLAFDATQREQVLAAAQQLNDPLDMVILNAGNSRYIDDALHFDSLLFEDLIRTNLLSVAYCLEAFNPKIKQGGQLALMGSSAAFFPFTRAEAYGSSKAAINYLASCLSVDLKAHQIDVSLITPGFVKTPLTDKNDFPMPMRISVEQAAEAIMQGLAKRKKLIYPPRLFVGTLSLLSKLPYGLKIWLAQRMVRT